ncbi:MAG: Alcohol dehydrogenase GroES domain protein [Amycolatopsis sp.]|uniref:alcohol dehydrogenase catalytic domain-containing protein n=1 Tax=Amycolatopsis sp. TaxID=37632 RepID=UPI00260E9AC4|nr:zinc-binding dehydrogenase [Amycolatopsis sp.]MCU1679413.1 Alcohol dehydrogenase GroES domain protein [Amycolatopsis sp.]
MRYSQVVGPRRSELIEGPELRPGPGEVVLRVRASGVCASEYHGWASHDGGEPVRFGHELAGTITEVGTDARGWRVGDDVTGLGGPGFADSAVMRADALLPVAAGTAFEHSLGEPLACLMEAFSRTPISPQDVVAVVGTGFMGLGFLQLARLAGPAELIAVDYDEHHRETALSLGATAAYHPDELPERYRAGVGVAVEAAGTASALTLAGDLVAPHGTLCIVGYHSQGSRALDLKWWYKAVSVVHGYTPQRFRVMKAMADGLALVAEHRFTYAPLVTHLIELSQVDTALGYFTDRPAGFIKSVVVP